MTPTQIRTLAIQVGGQCALARLLSVDPRTVRRWVAAAPSTPTKAQATALAVLWVARITDDAPPAP